MMARPSAFWISLGGILARTFCVFFAWLASPALEASAGVPSRALAVKVHRIRAHWRREDQLVFDTVDRS